MALKTAGAFRFVQDLVLERSGVVLDADKHYLADARLGPVLAAARLPSLDALVAALRTGASPDLPRQVVEAMLTTETSFFRNADLFELLRDKTLPALLAARADRRALSICSAGCSSGQEAYSLAMVLREHFPEVVESWDVRILATDISHAMIRRGREGTYSHLEVNRGLPARYLTHWFQRDGIRWQVRPEVRSLIEFHTANLLDESLPGPFDLVLLRNVMMYFAPRTRELLLRAVRDALAPDGMLFIGCTESILPNRIFDRHAEGRVACYRPRRSDGSRP